MSFDLLSAPIRKFIRDKGWEQLHAIQLGAIPRILNSDDNFILVSRTASGKTEAAFLPILTKINFDKMGVQVLYISPLIALINDQFFRIENLCKNLDIRVTKWHGEANKTQKKHLIEHPNGIVLITPESIEAMFVNKPFDVKQLFSNLSYVVIDEIHSFVGTDRGIQLKSLLSRLQNKNLKPFCIVGLSATMSEENKFREVKEFTGNADKTKIVIDRAAKEIHVLFRYFKNTDTELPLNLLKDLYLKTKDHKVLIFPNTRGRAEEVAVKLKKISDRVNGHPNYFSHHSSVDKEIREYVEHFAKNNQRQNFCISCTSTLELGIDIGSIDTVVQIDATHSIASLVQRVGRSGRKDEQCSNLVLYATNEWSLLQSLACWLLHKEGFIEPPQSIEKPYDILLHQILSISKEYSGISLSELLKQIKGNFAFSAIEEFEAKQIIKHLTEINLLESLGTELIVGVEGEKIVNNRDFYSVFKTEKNYKVIHVGKTIGEIPLSPQLVENENILLSAKIWKIQFIDHKAKKIEVIPANDGKKPMFLGSGANIHPKIREKMLEILYSDIEYPFLDEESADEIAGLRKDFAIFPIENLLTDRPILITESHLQLFTFTGTKINRTLQFLLSIADIKNVFDDSSSSFAFEISLQELQAKLKLLVMYLADIETHIAKYLQNTPTVLDFSKWGAFLPEKYQIKLVKENYFEIEQTIHLLNTIKLRKP